MEPTFKLTPSAYIERTHSRLATDQETSRDRLKNQLENASTDLNGQCMVIIGQGNEILDLFAKYPGHIFNSSNGNLGALVSRTSRAMAAASARFTIGQLTGAAFGALAGAKTEILSNPLSDEKPVSRGSEIRSMASHIMRRQRDTAAAQSRNYLVIQLIERGTGTAGIDLGSNSVRAGQLVGLLGPHV